MLKNYFTVAFRTLRKNPVHGFINIFGLSLGLASCILIALFVQHELSYDRFHERADHLYRAWVFEDYGDAETFLNTTTPLPLGETLVNSYPEIQDFVRVIENAGQVELGNEQLTQAVHIVDPNFFEVFSFPLIAGDPSQVMQNQTHAIITESTAEKYFGKGNALGQTIMLQFNDDQFRPYTVAGIAKDSPTTSSIQFEIAVPFQKNFFSDNALQAWFNVFGETYLLIDEEASITELRAKIPELSRLILGDDYRPGVYNIGLQPITSIHLDTSLPAGNEPISDPQYSFILSGIALLILLIACLNFVTLAIGRSSKRAMEVGIRKVIGAQQAQLRMQFWGEAVLLTLIALVVGLGLAWTGLPFFSQLAGRDLTIALNLESILFLSALILVVGLIAGSYPALVLASFKPIDILKRTLSIGGKRNRLRSGLVVAQLVMSVILIISTLGMREQLLFLQTKNLGFNKEAALVIPTNLPGPEGRSAAERLRVSLAANPRVKSVAASSFNIGDGWGKAGYTDEDGIYRVFWVNVITPEYLQTLDIKMTTGNDFNREAPGGLNRGIIVNEALVKEYGWTEPIGERLPGAGFDDHEIIGVVQDFHYSSLRNAIFPLVLTVNPDLVFSGIENYDGVSSFSPEITVRISGEDLPGMIAQLREAWEEVVPGQEFDYVFLDEAVDNQYRAEARLSNIVLLGAILSILVSCLGLFGLATLITARRTKEIGIRKSMGASSTTIMMMITREFSILVGLAVLIASPVSFFALNTWLQGFAFQTSLGAWVFIVAALLALAVTLLTVSYQTIRAAQLNPVKALRHD